MRDLEKKVKVIKTLSLFDQFSQRSIPGSLVTTHSSVGQIECRLEFFVQSKLCDDLENSVTYLVYLRKTHRL